MATNNQNLYRPTDPEAEQLLLRVEADTFNPDDRWRERLEAREASLTDGWPGFVVNGSMSNRQAHAYATRMQSGDLVRRNNRQYEIHPRFVSVYHDSGDEGQLLGLAEYGGSGTDWGARLRYEGEQPAHMDTIGVVSEVSGRKLNEAERYAIGTLLLHAVAVDSMTADSSPDGTIHTLLEYSVERTSLDGILRAIDRLDLRHLLKEDEEVTPGSKYAVPVLDEAAMDRRMLALPTRPLAEALVAQQVWVEEPRAA